MNNYNNLFIVQGEVKSLPCFHLDIGVKYILNSSTNTSLRKFGRKAIANR